MDRLSARERDVNTKSCQSIPHIAPTIRAVMRRILIAAIKNGYLTADQLGMPSGPKGEVTACR